MKYWNRIRDELLSPPQSRWLVWMVVPSCLMVFSGAAALSKTSLLFAFLLVLAPLLQLSYAITKKKGLFWLGFFGCLVVFLYGTWGESKEVFVWNVGWISALLSSLLLGYAIVQEAGGGLETRAIEEKELRRDLELWKNRFDTIKEKIASDKKMQEEMVEELHKKIAEKDEELASLRVVIYLSHQETRRAEEKAEKANQMVVEEREALRHRQTINESLQTKTGAKQSISIKDLARKR